MVFSSSQLNMLRRGGIAVIPTDTIYGMVGNAANKKTVERIYKVRKRNPKKPFIILISSVNDLHGFGVGLDAGTKKILNQVWPGKVSVILPCSSAQLAYLHRGTKTLAFRMPKPAWLRALLKKTGPLVAPSANPEGLTPAATIAQAKKYFGDQVDFYSDAGRRASKPSTLISVVSGKVIVLRKGAVKL